MAITTILELQTLIGFADSGDGVTFMYANSTGLAPFTLDRYYVVSWDGTEYRCVAKAIDGVVALGNEGIFGGTETGEPFILGILSAETTDMDTNTLMIYTTNTSQEGHAISISDFGATADGIVLKDYHGVDVGYDKVDAVMFDTPDGGTQVFSKGEAIGGIVLALDLTNGDQTVIAPEGTLVQSAIIKKPDTLLPENIRYGVDVAGVEGAFLGDPEERTVDLDMATGDLVIDPSADGKTMTKVTVIKPETLVPENIADGVNIGGVIGCLAEGGVDGGITIRQIATRNISGVAEDEYITAVASHAFAGTKITHAIFPACVSVGSYAFAQCTNLSYLHIDYNSLSVVEEHAFQGTPLPGNVSGLACTNVKAYAFQGCTLIENVYAPSVTAVGSYAFQGCSSLKTVQLSTGYSMVNEGAFAGCVNLTDIGDVELIKIYSSAFQNCKSLQSVNISALANIIGDYAFYGCTNLTTINGSIAISPDFVTNYQRPLGNSAFYGCSKLQSITLTVNSSLSYAPTYLFYGCSALSMVSLGSGTVVFPIDAMCFYGTPMSTSSYLGRFGSIYVPSSKYTAFCNASGWSTYRARIVSYRT